jgi:hypothetical protein
VVEGVRSYPIGIPLAGFVTCLALLGFQLVTWLG